jgi:DNA-binding CsgD family transcriptional regulator
MRQMSLRIDTVRMSTALESLYGATLCPSDRVMLPQVLASVLDATSSLLHLRGCGASGVSVIGASENLRALIPRYVEEKHDDDVWSVRVLKTPNRAVFGEEIVPEKELLAADWYHELCRPSGIHHVIGGSFEIEPDVKGLIGVQRPVDACAFAEDERVALQFLLPHLKQAYRLIRIADMNDRTRRLTLEVLSSLSVGVFIVRADAHVTLMNVAAEHMARTCRSLAISNNRLSLSDPKLDERLRASIRRASLAPFGRSLHAGETIVVPFDVGMAFSLMIVPLPPLAAPTGTAEFLAAVFVGDPSPNADPSTALLRAIYGLTPAETRLLLALLEGSCVSDYAQTAGVSLNTVKSQLKSVFLKTGCRRQAELVRKVVSDPMLRLAR